jgi:3-hydroxyisobutyrate dehydrogenase-like beta-hydroxyacid dehydrogenase
VSRGAPRLGIVGLGAMGARMARRLLDAGHEVAVHDAAPAAADALAASGATACASAREVADRATIVLVSLPAPEIVAAVARELIGGAELRTYVDLSTTGPDVAEEVADLLAAAGIGCVDAPVSGGPAGAEAGRLTLMVAAAPEAVAEARPVLERLGSLLVVGDRPGQGQTVKVINNLLSASAIAITAEAVALGVKAGIDPATLLDVVHVSSGASNAASTKFPQQVLTRRFDHGFRLALMAKDVRLCLAEAQRRGVPMLLGGLVAQLWTLGEAHTDEGADCTEIVRLIEGWAGTTIESQGAIA